MVRILAQASAFDHRQGVSCGGMRIVAWNCNMALERKVDGLLDLAPDIAIVCECAEPERLRLRSRSSWMQADPVWIGRNPHKGLAVFAFNGYAVRLAESYHPALRYIAPVHIGRPNATCWPCGPRTPAPAVSASTSWARCDGHCRATRAFSAGGRP
jgi:hypothetical protein